MNKYFLIIFAALGFSISLNAARLTPEQALARYTKSNGGMVVASAGIPELKYTAMSPEETAGAYVYATDGEYFVLAADDRMPALLGYGSSFDPTDIPEGLQWWLATVSSLESVIPTESHDPVEPLIQTKWGQNAPYNYQTPTVNGVHCVTGCVATATAQVVKYHGLPAGNGTGIHSYTWEGTTLSFDYGSTSFDWANMKDLYSGAYTTAQFNAVALLMRACGIGVNMKYTTSSSGAITPRIQDLLVNHLGYDCGLANLNREYFSTEEWDELIYGEIAAGRPVIYAGQSGNGGAGHCFVIDGYSSNGYYHVNWGWSGKSDGYFLLTNLSPNDLGTGGGSGGYNYDQDATIGIRPPVEGSVPYLSVSANTGFAYSDEYSAFFFGKSDTGYYGYYNRTANEIKIINGVALTDESGKVYYASGEEVTLPGYTAENRLSGSVFIRALIPRSLPAGSYKATPVGRFVGSDVWQPILIPVEENQYVLVRKGYNGVVTYDGSDPDEVEVPVSISDISQRAAWSSLGDKILDARVRNNLSGSAAIRLRFIFSRITDGAVYGNRSSWNLSLTPNFNGIKGFNATFEIPDGAYDCTAYDATHSVWISDAYRVYVGVCPTSVAISGDGDVAGETKQVLMGSEIQLTATVLPEDAFDRNVSWESDAPEIASVDENGVVKALALGDATITATSINGIEAKYRLEVVNEVTGLDVISDDRDMPVRYYNLQGIEVPEPQHGQILIECRGRQNRVVKF